MQILPGHLSQDGRDLQKKRIGDTRMLTMRNNTRTDNKKQIIVPKYTIHQQPTDDTRLFILE